MPLKAFCVNNENPRGRDQAHRLLPCTTSGQPAGFSPPRHMAEGLLGGRPKRNRAFTRIKDRYEGCKSLDGHTLTKPADDIWIDLGWFPRCRFAERSCSKRSNLPIHIDATVFRAPATATENDDSIASSFSKPDAFAHCTSPTSPFPWRSWPRRHVKSDRHRPGWCTLRELLLSGRIHTWWRSHASPAFVTVCLNDARDLVPWRLAVGGPETVASMWIGKFARLETPSAKNRIAEPTQITRNRRRASS